MAKLDVRVLANPTGGLEIVLYDQGNYDRPLAILGETEWDNLVDGARQEIKAAGKELAWINDDNEMETAEGIRYALVRRPIRGRKKPSSSLSSPRK